MPYVDRSPLNYRVNTTDPLSIRRETRAPVNNQDGFGDTLYTLWHDESSDDMYQLVQKSRGLSTTTWIALGGTGLSVEQFLPDSGTSPVVPNASNQVTMTGTNGLSFVGGLNTLTVQSDNGQLITKIIPDGGTNPVVPDSSGEITFTGAQVAASTIGANVIDSLGGLNTLTYRVQQSGSAAAQDTTLNGVCHFDSDEFTVTNGFVTLNTVSDCIINLTSIDDTDSPYTALSTDCYLSADVSSGVISILLPNAPTTGRVFYVKDVAGNAAANNITVTTVGGVVTIDGLTSQTIISNFGSLNFIFNGTSYEIF